jgi:hypothetical protein
MTHLQGEPHFPIEFLCRGAHIPRHGGRKGFRKKQRVISMTALLVEYFKLIMLFMLIGSIIGLSHLSGAKARPVRPRRRRGYGRPASARL